VEKEREKRVVTAEDDRGCDGGDHRAGHIAGRSRANYAPIAQKLGRPRRRACPLHVFGHAPPPAVASGGAETAVPALGTTLALAPGVSGFP
jgi:hypothetical protein